MLKKTHCLLLLMMLMLATGCQTLNGAARGLHQDVQSVSNPDENGWNAIENMDAWVRKNLW
jgi:hypothetical protein